MITFHILAFIIEANKSRCSIRARICLRRRRLAKNSFQRSDLWHSPAFVRHYRVYDFIIETFLLSRSLARFVLIISLFTDFLVSITVCRRGSMGQTSHDSLYGLFLLSSPFAFNVNLISSWKLLAADIILGNLLRETTAAGCDTRKLCLTLWRSG